VTAYVVTYSPVFSCTPRGAVHRLTQSSSVVWIDRMNRLVQIRSVYRFAGFPSAKVPAALRNFPHGPTTTVATLTLSRFGAPVRVSAPPPNEILHSGSTGSGSSSIKLKTSPCRSRSR